MRNRMNQWNRNNQGSTLILVLICMTFLGLLGSVILTATVSNMKMKTVDSLAQSNFYTAESAMDEYRIGLEETAQSCMKEAYTYMLSRYSTTPDTERTKLLMRRFVNLLYLELTGSPIDNGTNVETTVVNPEVLKERYLISHTGGQATTVSGSSIKIIKDLNDYTVTLQGVSLRYTDSLGYESTITTDIKVKATYPSLPNRNANKEGVYFTDFGLIADGVIQGEGTTTVNGNIYGGLGIHATDNHANVILNSQKVISREGLVASNKAKIQIPQPKDGVISNSVWVKNIVTEGTAAKENTDWALDITANCYVWDDLTLGEHNGNVKLAGNYYGYQMDNEPSGKADGNSSIVINAKNAVLDLSGLNNLWLSGKSYLKIPSLYGSDQGFEERQVLTGESLSFKGSQIAYLIPGKCIGGIEHNPMTADEYRNLQKNKAGYEVITNDPSLSGNIDMSQYVKPGTPYTAYYVNFLTKDDTMQMVYLYWNFLSTDHANQYFNKYQEKNLDKLSTLATTLQLGSVYLPVSYQMRVNTGNILSYDTNGLSFHRSGLYHGGGGISEITTIQTELSDKKLELGRQYMGLINYLKEDQHSDTITSSLVENLIYFQRDTTKNINGIIWDSLQKMNEQNTRDVYSKVDGGISDSYILVTTNEVVLETYDKKGIIITNQDVTIKNCNFTGLIITTGDITLNNATIKADSDYVKAILDATPEVSQYFKDFLAKDESTDGDANTVQITYENWFKE